MSFKQLQEEKQQQQQEEEEEEEQQVPSQAGANFNTPQALW